jgi:hypothetical protein
MQRIHPKPFAAVDQTTASPVHAAPIGRSWEVAPRPPLAALPAAEELRAIHEQAARSGWPPAAYLEVARWCRRHRPQFERLWLNLAMGVQL